MSATRPPGERAARDGAPLWLYLTALVLVPLLGVAGLTTVMVRSAVVESGSAARAAAAVGTVARLDAARSGVAHEMIPSLALTVIDDPASATELGVPVGQLATQRTMTLAMIEQSRAATDDALAPAGTVDSPTLADAARRVAELRALVDAHDLRVDLLYDRYLALLDDLGTAQREAVGAAASEELPAATLAATRDVQLVGELVTAAIGQMPTFFGAQLDWGRSGDFRQDWQADWAAYTAAQQVMGRLSQDSLREEWQAVSTSPAVTSVDGVLAAQAGDAAATALPLADLVRLVIGTSARDAALTDLLDSAAERAQDLAAADRARATDHRDLVLGIAAGLVLVSLLGALWVGRSISGALSLLADRAEHVSQGRLVDVPSVGPREARTVSRALASAVAGLRRIQHQARAIARGDLAHPVLDEPLPGPLGQLLHASVEQLVDTLRQRDTLQSALAHQAAHDPLTELPNRAQALSLVTAALHRGRRTGHPTGLLFVDLDGFKAVNDGHGHAAGDDVLQEVARRLRDAVRPGDVVCRLGGDEFVVLVEEAGSERDLLGLAERLIAAVSEPMTADGSAVRIGASIGIAVCRDADTDADALIAEADTAAYRAKHRGRGRAELFDEALRLQLSARSEMEAAIVAGLAAGEMTLHYQPVLDLAAGRLEGYEALVRWERPGVGTVPPGDFVPVAEESSLICDLDRWVLHEATRQLAEWRAADPVEPGEPEPTVAVNVSGRHLADRRILADVTDALAASGLPPRLLVLEVTETVLVNDPVAFTHLAALRELGTTIAIDDFGTGYTSIGQLGNMPVDTLKIDRSFVASTQPGHPELVALMIRAAHTFGLTVVAEGVEEEEQVAWLRDQACDQAQGYLLSRPLPAAAVAALRRPAVPAGA
ncbi:diguanylate cyclase (GGDEF) domain-containing protein [Geodermatophilus telluris]|uniref:Diguanylate cyclase (GGDEF) domain-containing protein n=1 Tax=Geodermatophilus telluris TaxID=1190417 RepID=A0A1G6U8V5_9ACTN|nr:EAL domain-containing protein [Geodermatophilus telluris]SDD37729.1 diguanylate cyclase (GGDEF) domain-containing protein [Geodermatophilus telluris]